jgi:hypothetical protein
MAVKPSKAFLQTMANHRRTLDRLADKKNLKGMQRLYTSAQSALEKKLADAIKSGRKDTMTVYQMTQLKAQIREGQARIAASMANAMKPLTKDTQAEAIRQAAKTITTLEKKFTGAELVLPLEEAATFSGLIEGRSSSLIRMSQTSFARYGSTLTAKMEQELATSLMTGETPMDAIDRVMGVASNEWWQAERIVRTETAYAFNASHADAIEEASSELPDLYQRWTEYVDDKTGQPLDARVGEDSLVLHGQVVQAGGQFIMPPDPRVSQKMWNQRYDHPPNRPNDRAVLLPWRKGWDAPAWIWSNGQRVSLS